MRSQAGFTMVEVLVGIVGSLIVGAALLGIIDVALRQSTNTFSRTDATGRTRSTVETLVGELQSSCISSGDTPIQAGSTGTSLVFYSASGNAATPTTTEHTIAFNSSAGTLTDTTSTGTTTLLTNVTQSGTTPVFQYFAYSEPTQAGGGAYTDSAGNPYEMLLDGTTPVPGTSTIPVSQPLATPLSTSSAETAAEVMITLSVGPAGGSLEKTATTTSTTASSPQISDTISDSAILRLSPVANHVGSGTTFGPCQ